MSKVLTISITVMLLTGSAAWADWDPGDPHKMHYPQLPDLDFTGMDVLATYPYPDPGGTGGQFGKVLADDWLCTDSGVVSDIHIWGSWLNDQYPGDPRDVEFTLSIHADIPDPDGTGPEYSQPGALLWQKTFFPFDPQVTARPYASAQEYFYDPNADEIIGFDTQVWQYNFFPQPLPTDPFPELFVQEEGTIYWLNVVARPVDGQSLFGWKTSLDHFNDDAVFGDTPDVALPPLTWSEMRYPLGHPFEGQSIDLAFVITPEPGTCTILAMVVGPMVLGRRRR